MNRNEQIRQHLSLSMPTKAESQAIEVIKEQFVTLSDTTKRQLLADLILHFQ